jgi:hypothetical protein
MGKIFLLLIIFGLSCEAFAQTNRASWESLSRLQPGQKIQVVGMNQPRAFGNSWILGTAIGAAMVPNTHRAPAKGKRISTSLSLL